MALPDSMDEGSAPSVVERINKAPLEELQQLLAKGGRETVIAEGPDGKPVLRRRKPKVIVGGPADNTRTFTLGQVLAAAGAVPLALAALFLLWWRPRLDLFGGSVVWGVLCGVALAYLYVKNSKQKDQLQQLVGAAGAGAPPPRGGRQPPTPGARGACGRQRARRQPRRHSASAAPRGAPLPIRTDRPRRPPLSS
jgi:hypothetical protein